METIAIPQGFRVTPQQFEQLANAEQLARLELTATGELIVMSPTGGTAGEKNFNLYLDLGIWNRQTKLGKAFDSSTVFVLPDGARRSPDVSWVRLDRWNQLTRQQQDGFPPLAPDFVIELVRTCPPNRIRRLVSSVSPSELKNQRYEGLQAKMPEYIDNGVRLGWLIEPDARTVEIYRPQQSVETLDNPATVSGENILPGFNLNLSEIFGS